MKTEIRLIMKDRLLKEESKVNKTSLRKNWDCPFLLEILENAKTMFAYMPIEGEVDITPIIEKAISLDITIGLPRIVENNLAFYKVDSDENNSLVYDDLEVASFGILEPKKSNKVLYDTNKKRNKLKKLFPLIVFVPGIAFSKNKNRLGRGAGFFDRFLAKLKFDYNKLKKLESQLTVIGLCYNFQIIKSLPTEIHDVPMDRIFVIDKCNYF